MHSRMSYYSYSEQQIIKRNIFFVCLTFILTMILFFSISEYVIRPVSIKNSAMEPSIGEEDYLFVALAGFKPKVATSVAADSAASLRGTPVLVYPFGRIQLSPVQNLVDKFVGFITFQQVFPYSRHNRMSSSGYVRRLVAFPGDEIYMSDFVLYVKPRGQSHFLTEFELAGVDYDTHITKLPLGWSDTMPFSGSFPPVTLGDDEFFVLSDNRMGSIDSRYWGSVPLSSLSGKLILRYLPFSRFGLFK